MINDIQIVIDCLNEVDLTDKAKMKKAILYSRAVLENTLTENQSKDDSFNDALRYDDEHPDYIKGSQEEI